VVLSCDSQDGLPGIELDVAHHLDPKTRIDRRLHDNTAITGGCGDLLRAKSFGRRPVPALVLNPEGLRSRPALVSAKVDPIV